MTRKEIDFLHFGERCGPYIIINVLLDIHKKTLFQLGVFPFNTIIQVLKDEKFEDIINTNYLTYNEKCVSFLEDDTFENFTHESKNLKNEKYQGLFLAHDYAIEGDDNKIINYNFIQKQHKIKISNFYESIRSGKFLCFICYSFDTSIDNFLYDEMVDVLKNKYNIEDFVIIIFTNENINDKLKLNIPKEYEIIFVDDYKNDIMMDTPYRLNLYRDMWEKFRFAMNKYGYTFNDFDNDYIEKKMPRL